jgi:hypothetical protein
MAWIVRAREGAVRAPRNRFPLGSLSAWSVVASTGTGQGEEQIVGISFGGILAIVGIVLMFVWSFWPGLIIALIGLIAFGGFARGKWY